MEGRSKSVLCSALELCLGLLKYCFAFFFFLLCESICCSEPDFCEMYNSFNCGKFDCGYECFKNHPFLTFPPHYFVVGEICQFLLVSITKNCSKDYMEGEN